ncbi:MAG: chemotaxis protein CheD [Candidatus Methanosuratus sp.]|nr:chemotaxis protein CheD [Candidatus Methanosuratincola sp.]
MYDPVNKIGGILHAMLPKAKETPLPKYVDSGTALLLKSILENGAQRNFLVAGIVGGGTIFNFGGELAIGKKNIQAAKAELAARRIPILVEEVDGKRGRSVLLDIINGKVMVMVSRPPILKECVALKT